MSAVLSLIGSAGVRQFFKAVLEDTVTSVVGNITDRVVSWQLAALAQGVFLDEFSGLLEAGTGQPRLAGENYIKPFIALGNTARLLEFAAKLAAISPELGEVIAEGLSEDLMTALQHLTTEPVERLFSVLFGAENIDSDDLSEAYAWGMMTPGMYAWLVAVDGLSNSSALASFLKAVGEKYAGDMRAVEDHAGAAAAKAWVYVWDSVDKLFEEARSALFGVPEAARTAFNEYVAEVNRLYTHALRRALEALANLEAAQRVGDARLQQSYLIKAEMRLAEAHGALEAADALAETLEAYEDALLPILDELLGEAVSAYVSARGLALARARAGLEDAARLMRGVQSDIAGEVADFVSALRDIRGSAPSAEPSDPDAVEPRPGYQAELLYAG